MTTYYQVTEAAATLYDEGGSATLVYQDAVFAGDGLDGEHLARLAEDKFITKVDAVIVEGSEDLKGPKAGTAEAVLAEVGDDPDKAAAALKVEQEQDKPRSTLAAKLQAIANPA